jgi:protein SCO1/2
MRKRRSPRLAAVVVLAAVLVLAATGCGGGGGRSTEDAAAYKGLLLPDRPKAPNFRLHDQNGKPVSLAAERGKWVMMTFLYTWCPDVCPVIAGNLNTALRSPTAKRAGLRVLSVSVDPKRDTPAAVRKYVRDHQLLPTFRWALGSEQELAEVWRAYNIVVMPDVKDTVSHSTVQLLIDPTGHERLVYDAHVQAADVVADLKTLQDE